MSFEGGSLRLKGEKKKVKKKKKEVLTGSTPVQKTAAELRFEETKRERLEERAAKTAEKSHKDRVNEFNSYLSRLSEHHDIRNTILTFSASWSWLKISFILIEIFALPFATKLLILWMIGFVQQLYRIAKI
jgi:hypothetical protein